MVAVVLVVLTCTSCGLGGDDQEKKIHSFQKNVDSGERELFLSARQGVGPR